MQHLTRLYSSNFKIKVKSFLAKILTIEMTHLKRLTSLHHFKFKWKLLKTSSNTAMTTNKKRRRKKRKGRRWNLMGESYPLQLNKWLSWTKSLLKSMKAKKLWKKVKIQFYLLIMMKMILMPSLKDVTQLGIRKRKKSRKWLTNWWPVWHFQKLVKWTPSLICSRR